MTGRLTIGVIAAAVLVSGCGAGAAPLPVRSQPVRPTEAPAVPKVLDLSKATDPCAVVPKSLPLGLGVYGDGQPHAGTDPGSLYCVWADRVEWPRISVGFSGNDPLAAAYRDSDRVAPGGSGLRWKLFEVNSIEGQPAVVRSHRVDGTVLCEVVVGAGKGGGVIVAAGASGANDTSGQCDTAVASAGQVVRSLR
ncbi:DUF3558 family protein [Actinokineospora pegani]|uniref:DUF3558 family protein n=1 Tax=Actinokineospora pegani TaxID=2654637 RepID=UPI0018D41108|nr:DUF3558 family protein [Actinokineospora pegani]